MNQLIRNLTNNNKSVVLSFSIILTALITALAILIPSGFFQRAYKGYFNWVPKVVWFNKLSEISNYSNISDILTAQPRISYRPSIKYVLVEVSDMDCSVCAQMHGYLRTDNLSVYERIMQDFVITGKAEYTWIDTQTRGSIKKHSSLYCVGEQSPKAFFEYREKLFRNYAPYSDATALKYAKESKVNIKKYEECMASGKYEDRVKKLTEFNDAVLQSQATPTLYLYQLQEHKVKKISGEQEKQFIANQLTTITNTTDYDLVIKPELEKYLSK